jgi:hypothetical protein
VTAEWWQRVDRAASSHEQGRIIGEAKAAGRDPPTSHHLMFNMNFYQGVRRPAPHHTH